MRALLITAAAVGAAIMLAGCPHKRSQPVPGPQSAPTRTATGVVGRLDEAFSPHPCRQRRLLFHY